jgi:hypothetical protein
MACALWRSARVRTGCKYNTFGELGVDNQCNIDINFYNTDVPPKKG